MADIEHVLENIDLGEEPPATPGPSQVTETEQDETQVQSEQTEATEGEQEPAGESAQTPKETKPKTDSVPLATHLEMKRQLREARLRLARQEASRVAPQPEKPAVPEKSPLELFAEREGKGAVPTAEVLIEQRQWEQRQGQVAQDASRQSAAAQSIIAHTQAMTDETMGEGLGFESLWDMGRTLLTQEDEDMVRAAGKQAGPVLYRTLVERILETKSPQAKLLSQAIRQQRGQVASTPNPTVQPVKKPTEAPTREQVLNPTPIHGASDLTGFFGI